MTTTDLHADFLSRIQSEPDPRVAQSIYADWLEEQGDPRAELLRLAVEIRSRPEGRKQYGLLNKARRYVEQDRQQFFGDQGEAWQSWRHKAKLPVVRYRMPRRRHSLITTEAWLWTHRKSQRSDSSKFQGWLRNREFRTA